MSGAHQVSWWGALDPYSFGVWCSEDKIFDLPDPQEAAQLFRLSLVMAPSDQHRAFVSSLGSSDERVLACTLFSVYSHEWRHWYDATSTPCGMWRTGQLSAFFATVTGIEGVLKGYDRLFVPLLRWVKAPELIRVVEPDLPELDPVIVSIVQQAREVLRKADFALNARTTIGRIAISTAQILESLAMLQQETTVATAFGEDAARKMRAWMSARPGGHSYYAAVELVEAKAGTDRATVTTILEAALFGDYGVHGSLYELTPPRILEGLLGLGRFNETDDVEREVDFVLTRLQGFDRQQAHNHTYNSINKSLERMAEVPEQFAADSDAYLLRATLTEALGNAFVLGGAARFRGDLIKQGIDADTLPNADPYSYYAPLVVEGFPGQVGPASKMNHTLTLAGYDFPSYHSAAEFTQIVSTNAAGNWPDVEILDEPYRWSVLWTPNPGDESLPPYFKVIDVIRLLLYWRGILFGAGGMSPFTFWCTTYADAEAQGQVLVGPGVPRIPQRRHTGNAEPDS